MKPRWLYTVAQRIKGWQNAIRTRVAQEAVSLISRQKIILPLYNPSAGF